MDCKRGLQQARKLLTVHKIVRLLYPCAAELGCPSGTYKSASGSECEPCPVGYYGPGGYPYPKVCHACPEGFTTPGRGSYSAEQCGEQPATAAREQLGEQLPPQRQQQQRPGQGGIVRWQQHMPPQSVYRVCH